MYGLHFLHWNCVGQWFPKCGSISASPETILETQILKLHLDLLDQKLREWDAEIWVLASSLGDSNGC